MERWDTAKIEVCAHSKFYVSQLKGSSSVQFLEFLAQYAHRMRCDYMVHRHNCQYDQYRPHQQSGEHKIFLSPCQSILNMYFVHIFLSFFRQKKKRMNKKGGIKRKTLKSCLGIRSLNSHFGNLYLKEDVWPSVIQIMTKCLYYYFSTLNMTCRKEEVWPGEVQRMSLPESS